MYISAARFVAPITLVGFTALSVEIITKRFTPNSMERSAHTLVPSTLVTTAVDGWNSIIGTCLYAAAWNTRFGCAHWKICRIRWRLLTLATMGLISVPVFIAVSSSQRSLSGVSAWSMSTTFLHRN